LVFYAPTKGVFAFCGCFFALFGGGMAAVRGWILVGCTKKPGLWRKNKFIAIFGIYWHPLRENATNL